MLRTKVATLLLASSVLITGCESANKATAPVLVSVTHTKEPPSNGAALLETRCSGCHAPLPEGGYSRISQIRKTPEGWFMTLVRMEREGRTYLQDDERRTLVKYLADTQGLAPSETEDFRYILEKQPNLIENPADSELATMCGRCHSNGRYSLQRRDSQEWKKLVNFHVAQFPTLEYQALSADRRWFEEATTLYSERLGKRFPLATETWHQWLNKPEVDVAGNWRVTGRVPGNGNYYGVATITHRGGDNYLASYRLSFASGEQWTGNSDALVYTGYEWRGAAEIEGQQVREVYALSEDGNQLSGRWFLRDNDERGGQWTAIRMGDESRLLAVEPAYLKVGETTRLTLHGVNLSGKPELGTGLKTTVVARSNTEIVVEVAAAPNTALGARSVSVGDTRQEKLLTVYDRVDRVKVVPEQAIARVGGGGGKLEPVVAQFEVIGFMNGADGVADSADDIEIGYLPARWSIDNADELAAQMNDAQFAGHIDQAGTFFPAEAGINPNRHIATNNVGVLLVNGTVVDGDQTLSDQARLVVTVQRFIDPPIR